MANIMEYLDWRGDIELSVDGFNEVDNLILSQIAYTDFEKILSDGESLSIEEAAEKYFSLHTEKEIEERNTFYKYAPMVLKKAASVKRYKGTVLRNYVNIVNSDNNEQFSAMVFGLMGGVSYVAYRGTDNTITGWHEDFNLSFLNETPGQRRAVDFLNMSMGDSADKVYVGGHSKGGNFAVYAAAFCKKSIQDRIITVYSNDGPGFRTGILERPEISLILPKVKSLMPEESVVGILLDKNYNSEIIESSAKGINQHDPMTWKVYGRQFVRREERSLGSILVDKTMMQWLSTMSDEDREFITDAVFSSIDSTGAKTVEDVSDGGIKLISDMLKSIKELPQDKQQELSGMVKRLVRISSDFFFSDMKDRALQMIEKAPKLGEKVIENGQKMFENAPKVFENAPKVFENAPKMFDKVTTGRAKTEQRAASTEQLTSEKVDDSTVKDNPKSSEASKKNKPDNDSSLDIMKKLLRDSIRLERKNMSRSDVQNKSSNICNRIIRLGEYEEAENILAYMSAGNEVDLSIVIENAMRTGKKVYIPKVISNGKMEFYLYDGSLVTGSFGIREPAKTDEEHRFDIEGLIAGDKPKGKTIILIPAVAFDEEKHRLGQGGGFYDRYLEKVDYDKALQVGVAYELQIMKQIPHSDKDKKPQLIATELRIF